ncbi:MAG: DUF4340 domain-containing protein [Deltaproteobacteria bacterium]|nr:DUF4340 domain-containing protein [Deltaproteobacteria bacterium]
MTNRYLILLGIIAAFMAAVTIAVSPGERKAGDTFVRDSYLIQGLDPDKVARIEIISGEKKTELMRESDRFLLASKYKYPAQTEAVNRLLYRITDIKCRLRVTESQENFETLGVAGKDATTVSFYNDSGSRIVGVVLGNQANDMKGGYVRLEGDSTVFLSSDPLPKIQNDFMDYIMSKILPGLFKDYNKIRVEFGGKACDVTIGEKSLKVRSLSGAGISVSDPDGLEQSLETILRTKVVDVLPFQEMEGAKTDLRLTWTGKNKVVYSLNVLQKLNARYIVVTADVDYQGGELTIGKDEAEESLREKEKLLLARDRAMEFNNEHRGWAYSLSDDAMNEIRGIPPKCSL